MGKKNAQTQKQEKLGAEKTTKIAVTGSYLDTMDIDGTSVMEIVNADKKGLMTAVIHVRDKDGNGTTALTITSGAAITAYGRLEALTRIHEKAGIALCAELAHARKENIYKDFGINRFSDWVERVFGLSRKTAEIYAHIGEVLIERNEKDGKVFYTLKYGLEPYKDSLSTGHLLEMLKFFANGAERPDTFDIPTELRLMCDCGMYVSVKKMREAIKQYIEQENSPVITSEEITTDSQQSEEKPEQTAGLPEKITSVVVDSEDSARTAFAAATMAFQSAVENVKQYMSNEDRTTIREIVAKIRAIQF